MSDEFNDIEGTESEGDSPYENEVLIILNRLDERTERMDERIEDNSVRLFEVKKNTQKNRNRIARIRGGLVVVGALSTAALGGVITYILDLF